MSAPPVRSAGDDLLTLDVAVTLLDARGPADWRDRVNVRTLDMENPTRCVLGQVYGDFFAGAAQLLSSVPMGLGALRAFTTCFPRDLWVEYLHVARTAA